MTQRSCRVCGGWHRLEEDWPAECVGHFHSGDSKRSDLSAPMIIPDTIGAVQSQLTGKFYDSKSSLRKEYKAFGVTELGNEKPHNKVAKKPSVTKKEIAEAVNKIKQGYRPNTEHANISARQTGSAWH